MTPAGPGVWLLKTVVGEEVELVVDLVDDTNIHPILNTVKVGAVGGSDLTSNTVKLDLP